MNNNDIKVESISSTKEISQREQFQQLYTDSPIPLNEQLSNLGLFLKRQDLTRLLFMNELYQEIVNVHGVVIEFGVRWGQNLALFESFRGIYEPYNYNRKIVGFDTFEGFPTVHDKDGSAESIAIGAYSVTENYDAYLGKILEYHEKESPIGHVKKHELIKGDAVKNLKEYLQKHPETIIAFAYFDFDLYEPTKQCLELIKDHLTQGSIIGFDELNMHAFPGETLAFKEVLGLDHYKIERNRYSTTQSFIRIEKPFKK